MEILKFEDAPKRSSVKRGKNSSRKTILGVAAAAAIAVMGSTLAANISINTANGGSLEFGQGLTQTTACTGSGSIKLTPTSSFANSAGAGTFYLSQIRFDFQDSSSASTSSLCNNNTFTIKGWDASSSNALTIASSAGVGYSSATFAFSTTANGVTKSSPGTTVGGGGSFATLGFSNLGTGIATSGAIAKLTVESN
jgi:hypothetical protein